MAGRSKRTADNPRVVFGANVRRMRTTHGLSQEGLAERSGLHRTYISSLERGQRNVGIDNIKKLSEALGVTVSDLLVGV